MKVFLQSCQRWLGGVSRLNSESEVIGNGKCRDRNESSSPGTLESQYLKG